ncbi:GGDEF domain-containing protein [Burkholderiaceae bacterium DAT-1]|nr:GGDEF domain-containing protein [Burkholderiaceae bacterium DAT-1]
MRTMRLGCLAPVFYLACLLASRSAASADFLTRDEREWIAAHPVILCASNIQRPPFLYLTDQDKQGGLTIHYLSAVSRLTGLKFQFVQPTMSDASTDQLKAKSVDLLLSMASPDQMIAGKGFSLEYLRLPAVLLRKGAQIAGNRELSKIVADYAIHPGELSLTGKGAVQLVHAVSSTAARQQFQASAVDAIVTDLGSAMYDLNHDGEFGVSLEGKLPGEYRLFMQWRDDWDMLGRILNKSLNSMTPDVRQAIFTTEVLKAPRPQTIPTWAYLSMGTAILLLMTLAALMLWNRSLTRVVAKRTRALQEELTERSRIQEKLRALAEQDHLTCLPNRASLDRELRRAIQLGVRMGNGVAVLFVDLDGFKAINDTMGHEAGDTLLKSAAARMTAAVRASDIVSRLGGDEFVIVLQGIESDVQCAQVAAKVILDVGEPYDLNGRSAYVTCSVGISRFPSDSTDASELLRQADAAMYCAKSAGRNRYHFHAADVSPIAVIGQRRSSEEG